jgi:dCMP deaminase
MTQQINKWDRRYLELSRVVSTWSKDPSKKIGALIVGDKGQIISQGYNGFPRGIEDSQERYNDRPTKYKYVVHAEANAIYNAIHNGASVQGCTIYVTGLPVCHDCAKAIIQTGIKTVVMDCLPEGNWKESGELSLEMFEEAGILVKHIADSGEAN